MPVDGEELIMHNRKLIQTMVILLVLVILTLLSESGCSLNRGRSVDRNDLIEVVITRVVDGDTAIARFSDGREERIRFIGVDSPEIDHPVKGQEPLGPEAMAYTQQHLEGKTIWLEIDLAERDRYGRVLAYLWLDPPEKINDSTIREKMFNARLLLDGYAVQVIFPPNVRYVDYFRIYAAEARKEGRGMWKNGEIIEK